MSARWTGSIRQDGGQTIAEGTAELIAKFPDHEPLIRAFYERWHEMIGGVLEDGVATLDKLDAAGVPLFGLTNWSDETFPVCVGALSGAAAFPRHRRVRPREDGEAGSGDFR